MKRKLSLIFAIIVCLLCLFTVCLGGCKDSEPDVTGATYIEGSFNVTHSIYNASLKTQYIDCKMSFKVDVESDYELEFTAYGWQGEKRIWEQTVTAEFFSSVNDNYVLTKSFTVLTDATAWDVTISGVTVTRVGGGDNVGTDNGNDEGKKPYYAIAIAFGAFAALLLGGLIALFVLDKKGVLKGKK